jgi:hypothetical protein
MHVLSGRRGDVLAADQPAPATDYDRQHRVLACAGPEAPITDEPHFMKAGACIFCGKVRKLTEEHLLGKWLKELFIAAGLPIGGAYSKLGFVGEDIPRSERLYPTALFEQTVRAVCETCNNGWMSQLEGAVQPFLGAMILRGQQTRLTRHDQRHLAAWAVKTLLVSQRMQPDKRVIPDSVYDEFYKAQTPADKHMVWLGARGIIDKDDTGGELIAAAQVGPLDKFSVLASMSEKRQREIEAGNFYVGTLVVGRVALQMFGHDLARGFDFIRNPPDLLFRIWKVQSHIVWPPPVAVGSFEGLHESLEPPRNEPT